MEDPQQPVDQQVTSKTPATKQKNPKRVAAGKAIAERTRIAREAQRKAFIKAQSIIAQAKQADPPAQPSVADPPAPPSVAGPPSETTKNALTTTQGLFSQTLSVIIIIVSLVGIYYKREEIKNVFAKKATPPRRLFYRERLQGESHRWIEHFICFYNGSGSSFLKSSRRQWDIHDLG